MAEQTATETATAKQKKPKSKILLIIIAVILVAGGAGAAWFLRSRPRSSAPAPVVKAPQYTVHLESFTVNLADPEETHFLRVTIDLGLAKAPAGDGKEGAEASGFPSARTRDALLSVLTASKANDLLTPEGKATLKSNLLTALQQKVPEIEAQDVYFTEFLVQR
jgi:flagellar protein FliL